MDEQFLTNDPIIHILRILGWNYMTPISKLRLVYKRAANDVCLIKWQMRRTKILLALLDDSDDKLVVIKGEGIFNKYSLHIRAIEILSRRQNK